MSLPAPLVPLSPDHRAQSLARADAETFDIVVVGGGITGAGAALDAASRGLSVALIEACDYAAGASSKSSKLIHGGLRYLEMLEFGLVKEALRERHLLLTTLAPHLVRPVPFVWPLTHRFWERAYVGAGVKFYDSIGGGKSLPRARHLTRRGVLKVAPALRPEVLFGGIQFYDAQEDDARMAMFVARTAAQYGAALATNVRADRFLSVEGRVVGVEAFDLLTKQQVGLRARHVVTAVGAWTDQLVLSPQADVPADRQVQPSKGIHIVVPRECIRMRTGVLTRTEKSVLFIIPWEDFWLIGDTDTPWGHDTSHPTATAADIEYLLAKANAVLRRPLTRSDVIGVFAGLRPLASAPSSGIDTTKISREHAILSPAPGLSTITGGKYTTYRVMARDLIDRAVESAGLSCSASATDKIPLAGADGFREFQSQVPALALQWGISEAQVRRLQARYGTLTHEVAALFLEQPHLKSPLGTGAAEHVLRAEICYASSSEGAVRLADVMERRTRLAIQMPDRGNAVVDEVANLMAGVLGWDRARTSQEVEQYRSAAAAEIRAQAAGTDGEAVMHRLRAPDIAQFYPQQEIVTPISAETPL